MRALGDTVRKSVCGPLQQECGRGDKPVACYYMTPCTILKARWAKHYRKAGNYQGKEMYHSTNGFQNYIHHECNICRPQNYCSREWPFQIFRLIRPWSLPDCYIPEISNNFKDIIHIGPDVPLTMVKSDEYLEEFDILRSVSVDESPKKRR